MQTKGRGRVGKKWISKKGNLFFSIFFKLDKIKINFKQFAKLNALIMKKLISKKFSNEIKIKWPNDLLFEKKKFCGILQEIINFNQYKFLIIGIGINTNIMLKNKGFQSTCLKNIIDKKINNQEILKNVLEAYEKFLYKVKKKSFLDLKKEYK